jgi:hypothetical protein
VIAIVSKYAKLGEGFSKREILKASEDPGRRTKAHGYTSASAAIDNRVAQRLGIVLCGYCRPKFNPKAVHYRRAWIPNGANIDPYRTDGKCEDCKQLTINTPGGGVMWVAEEQYHHVFHEPSGMRNAMWERLRNLFYRR